MSYNATYCRSFRFSSKSQEKENWEKLMIADQRDWNLIYQNYKPILSKYIGNVLLKAHSGNADAVTELSLLEEVFQWDEKFFTDWEIEIPNFIHTVEYDSFEEMNQALLGESCPDEDARDVWEDHCGSSSCYWSHAFGREVLITDLRLK